MYEADKRNESKSPDASISTVTQLSIECNHLLAAFDSCYVYILYIYAWINVPINDRIVYIHICNADITDSYTKEKKIVDRKSSHQLLNRLPGGLQDQSLHLWYYMYIVYTKRIGKLAPSAVVVNKRQLKYIYSWRAIIVAIIV